MPDLKISQLTGGGAAQAADEFPIARSGGNNKITGANVAAAATSVGTLTSLTVSGAITGATTTNTINGVIINSGAVSGVSTLTMSGNLTVDTNTLFVDAANNRVGVGTASPLAQFTVQADASANGINIVGRSAGQEEVFLMFYKNNASTINCGILGDNQGLKFAMGSAATQIAMFDTSGNLGLGVTPSARLTVLTPTSDATVGFNLRAYATGADGDRTVISRYTSSNDGNWANSVYRAWAHIWETNGTERARITPGGNVVMGASAALATNATDGFLYVPTCAGTPTGTPTAITGMVPIVVDTTNNKLYFYSSAQWRDAGP